MEKLTFEILKQAVEAKACAFALKKMLVTKDLETEFKKEYLEQIKIIASELEQKLDLKFDLPFSE